MAQDKRRFDVAVIGAGITGLAAALHLESRGISRIALSSSTKPGGATRSAAGLGTAGFIDNFTRFSHHYGAAAAGELWRFGDEACRAFVKGVRGLGLAVATGRHVRLITGEDELVEARLAVPQLKGQGFAADLTEKVPAIDGLGLSERVLAVQEDETKTGPRAMAVDLPLLMNALAATVKAERIPAVTRIRHEAGGLVLVHEDGSETACEMAICAAHLGIGALVPEIASALVSVADQWCRVRFEDGRGFPETLVGSVFSAKHGHEWGGFAAPGELILGGARYLRKWAGIEADRAELMPQISEHLLKLVGQTFKLDGRPQIVGASAFLDCRPCDELPIIGPLFGSGRLLIATGYLGAGLTLGWLAGDCLAELVATGTCARLPRRLWPERLRSLEG